MNKLYFPIFKKGGYITKALPGTKVLSETDHEPIFVRRETTRKIGPMTSPIVSETIEERNSGDWPNVYAGRVIENGDTTYFVLPTNYLFNRDQPDYYLPYSPKLANLAAAKQDFYDNLLQTTWTPNIAARNRALDEIINNLGDQYEYEYYPEGAYARMNSPMPAAGEPLEEIRVNGNTYMQRVPYNDHPPYDGRYVYLEPNWVGPTWNDSLTGATYDEMLKQYNEAINKVKAQDKVRKQVRDAKNRVKK